MNKKRTYFGKTTAQQRRLLFETWEETGDVRTACTIARVSKGTFYYWKPCFESDGYPGLESFKSSAPKKHFKTSPDVENRVIAMYQEHPTWGKQRIADELAKENNWVPLVSVNTVRRILRDAGLWTEAGAVDCKKNRRRLSVPRKNRDKP